MAYRYDDDLKFMDRASHEDLTDLVYVLTHDPKDGETRWTEELSSKLKKCRDYHDRWHDIAGELQCFGGDTFANIMRGGKGVPYRELLCDVCEHCDIKYNKKSSNIENIEDALVAAQLQKFWAVWDKETKYYFTLYSKLYGDNSGNRVAATSPDSLNSTFVPASIMHLLSGGGLGSSIATTAISGITAASITGASLGSIKDTEIPMRRQKKSVQGAN